MRFLFYMIMRWEARRKNGSRGFTYFHILVNYQYIKSLWREKSNEKEQEVTSFVKLMSHTTRSTSGEYLMAFSWLRRAGGGHILSRVVCCIELHSIMTDPTTRGSICHSLLPYLLLAIHLFPNLSLIVFSAFWSFVYLNQLDYYFWHFLQHPSFNCIEGV